VDELGRTKLLLDLSNVEFLSSAGVGKLITLNRKVDRLGGRLVLCNVAPSVDEVFGIVRRLFTVFTDEEEGLAGIACRVRPPKPSDGQSAALRLPPSELD
jgi:anti-sigma B factor antagonist